MKDINRQFGETSREIEKRFGRWEAINRTIEEILAGSR
jgi:hypothetical protein